MVVNFDFLDDEPIENVITNLNFRIDKTVYFGYSDSIRKYRETLESFLKKYCAGQEAEFIPVPKGKLGETLSIMRDAVQAERKGDNLVFFDVTGGEAMPMVAFGILSTETDTPIHIFNVESNRLLEQDDGAEFEISKAVPRRNTAFTVEMLVELRGGSVNTMQMKKSKDPENDEDLAATEKLIALFNGNAAGWSRLISVIHACLSDDGDGSFHIDYDTVADRYYSSNVKRIRRFIRELTDAGLIMLLSDDGDSVKFRFVSDFVRANLTEEGAVLELMTCLELRKKYGQAQAGVVIDWDSTAGDMDDVINEIDVLALDGFVPVLVSCKCGNQANKDAIYELETVARRFGGKYARKMLVSAKNMTPADKRRAAEMGIDIRVIDKDIQVRKYKK